MLLTQKFNSAKDIDAEFIPTLESLLSDCVPSFDWLLDHETNSPENIHFHYYLFFGERTNAPIGFAQVAIKKESKKSSSFLAKFVSKDKRHAKAKWIVPGSFQEAIVFDPKYRKAGLDKASKIFKEFEQREDIEEQTLRFGQAYTDLSQTFTGQLTKQSERIVPDTLVKNQGDYQGYLNSLTEETRLKTMQQWKELHKKSFSFNEYDDFKEIFAYKENGAKLYKQLKQSQTIKKYLKLNCTYFTLEKDKTLLGIVFLIKGYGHHYFYDYHTLSDAYEESALHQMAIMNFYEEEFSNRLHLLFQPKDSHYFTQVGFTFRKQIELTYTNN